MAVVRVLELPNRALVWPSSLTSTALTQTTSWEQTQQRRLMGRDALKLADAAGVNTLAARLQARQTRILEIRRTQFEAEERLRVAGEAEEDRVNQEQSVLTEMRALQDDLSLARAQYEISRALASPANDALFVPDEPEKIEAEVRRLKAANLRAEIQTDVTTGVRRARVLWPDKLVPRNIRVLYAASREALKVLCDQLEQKIVEAETQAEGTRRQRSAEREEEIKRQVARRLEGIRSQRESLNLRLDQEDNLGKTLLAEELPTRRASVEDRSAKLPQAPFPLQSSRLVRGTSLPSTPSLAAEQEEVRAMVLDEAQRRGIRVRFSPAPGVPDRTVEFENWIRVKLP